MQSYYSRQAVRPHFSGHTRQRGSGLGSLAAGVGRVALPFAKKVILPAVKSIGKEFFVQSLPELMDAALKKKSPKQAAKSAVKRTVKKQIGGSASIKKSKPVKRNSRRKKLQRSRSNFFSRVKNVT